MTKSCGAPSSLLLQEIGKVSCTLLRQHRANLVDHQTHLGAFFALRPVFFAAIAPYSFQGAAPRQASNARCFEARGVGSEGSRVKPRANAERASPPPIAINTPLPAISADRENNHTQHIIARGLTVQEHADVPDRSVCRTSEMVVPTVATCRTHRA